MLEPLYDRLADVGGVDAWQAITLSIRLLEDLLKEEVERGSKLYWEENGELSEFTFD